MLETLIFHSHVLCAQNFTNQLKDFYSYSDHIGCLAEMQCCSVNCVCVCSSLAFPKGVGNTVHHCSLCAINGKYAGIIAVCGIVNNTSNHLAWLETITLPWTFGNDHSILVFMLYFYYR